MQIWSPNPHHTDKEAEGQGRSVACQGQTTYKGQT